MFTYLLTNSDAKRTKEREEKRTGRKSNKKKQKENVETEEESARINSSSAQSCTRYSVHETRVYELVPVVVVYISSSVVVVS